MSTRHWSMKSTYNMYSKQIKKKNQKYKSSYNINKKNVMS